MNDGVLLVFPHTASASLPSFISVGVISSEPRHQTRGRGTPAVLAALCVTSKTITQLYPFMLAVTVHVRAAVFF